MQKNDNAPHSAGSASIIDQLTCRRGVLKAGISVATAAALTAMNTTPALALPSGGVYNVAFSNLHTGETFAGAYRVGNKYLPEAFHRINVVLRDFRNDEVFPIDPRVIDIIAMVHRMTGSNNPYGVLSGYRSPRTNNMLRKASGGVAKNSLHMSGQAIDVRLTDYNTGRLKQLASKLHAGGVGYYPRSDFVHMDSGTFRTW